MGFPLTPHPTPLQIMCSTTGDLIKDPVLLPTSGIVLDRTFIQRCLLDKEEDPFNRKFLQFSAVQPLPELKAAIGAWVAAKRAGDADRQAATLAAAAALRTAVEERWRVENQPAPRESAAASAAAPGSPAVAPVAASAPQVTAGGMASPGAAAALAAVAAAGAAETDGDNAELAAALALSLAGAASEGGGIAEPSAGAGGAAPSGGVGVAAPSEEDELAEAIRLSLADEGGA